MKVSKKKRFAICYNSIRRVIILTRINSKYDINYFQHPDWFYPVNECNTREAVNYIKEVLKYNTSVILLKH